MSAARSARAARRILEADPVMAGLIAAAGPFRLEPLAGDAAERAPFEVLVRAIAHQQLHGKAAQRILARFIGLYGGATFPRPQQLLDTEPERLRAVGWSHAKIAALKDLARRTVAGELPAPAELDALSDLAIIERLTAVRGIGRWTVEMLLIFHLRRPDVLPVDDFGVRNGFRLAYRLPGLPTARALAQFGERWRPYRSIAAWYLWRAVELAHDGRLPRGVRPRAVAIQGAAGQGPRTRRRR